MDMAKTPRSLQDLIDAHPNLVEYFYNETVSPHSRGRAVHNPVPPEVSNWQDEQRAWRQAAVLFDQSHHMPEMFLKGPDAFRLLNYLGINSFRNFAPGKAKQFVGCGPDGRVVGECVLYYLEEGSFELVSGMQFQNWVEYNALAGGYDVSIERDLPTSMNPKGRRKFRFGMDGPDAENVFREVVEGEAPDIPFFNTARVRIAGCDVLALRHGMAGHKGVELSGRFGDGPKVRAAILDAGSRYGLIAAGSLAYFSSPSESGWIAYPVPAIYTGEEMRAFRDWLPATGWEAQTQIGGSFYSSNIEDYYRSPWDLGYDHILKFDHDFIGREALEAEKREDHRTKVTLVWNGDDVATIFKSLVEPGLPYKSIRLPVASYAFQQTDEVRNKSGEFIGVSTFAGYSANENSLLSLAMIDYGAAEIGEEVLLTWGEPNGGSRKPGVERHAQMQLRAKIAPVPYARKVRELKQAALSRP